MFDIESFTICSTEVTYQNVLNSVLHQTQINENSRKQIQEIQVRNLTSFMTNSNILLIKLLTPLISEILGHLAISALEGFQLKRVKLRTFFGKFGDIGPNVLPFDNQLTNFSDVLTTEILKFFKDVWFLKGHLVYSQDFKCFLKF